MEQSIIAVKTSWQYQMVMEAKITISTNILTSSREIVLTEEKEILQPFRRDSFLSLHALSP